METQMIVRINSELKDKVSKLAKMEGKNTSDIVRNLLEGYIQNRDMSGYIDSLWKKISNKMESKGVSKSDIKNAIASARAEKKI